MHARRKKTKPATAEAKTKTRKRKRNAQFFRGGGRVCYFGVLLILMFELHLTCTEECLFFDHVEIF